jgi:hypothetical protein
MSTKFVTTCLLALLLFCPHGRCRALAAQAGASVLRVSVLDPNGDAVVPARVRVQSGERPERTSTTNERGEATFSNLIPGEYQVQVEAEGFAPGRLDGVVVNSGSNLAEVRLAVAALNEAVVVGQDARERQTDPRGDAFTNILTEEQIADLPDDPEQLEATLKRMAGPGAVIRVNGFGGGRLPPKSQIHQIRFRQNSYAAEYHEAGLIGIDIIMKPGVNSWHGSLNFGFSDEALNARNAFAPARSPEQMRRFGVSLDGPIVRGRTSLFLNAEGSQSAETKTVVAELPSGPFTDLASRTSHNLYASGRLIHALSKTHTLGLSFQHDVQRNGNLGVGSFNLAERAYNFGHAENVLRLSDTGTLGQKLFNEFRLQLIRQETRLTPGSDAPSVIVLDSFNGGGAQVQSDKREMSLEVADNLDFAFGRHAMRAGLLANAGVYRNDGIFNANGTFTFASLEDFRRGRPSTFTQRVGDRSARFSQYQIGVYWQDDMRLRPGLTLSFGLRYELQNSFYDRNNFAPRFGLAWSPFKDGRTTIRAGAGIFYDWLGADVYGDIVSVDGRRQFDVVVIDPSFPDLSAGGRVVLPPSRLQLDPALANPYLGQASVSVERQLGRGLSLRASYLYQRGVHLLRGRDINAPVPALGRPQPSAGNLVQVESTAESRMHTFNLNLSSALSKRLYWLVDYSFSNSETDTDGPFALPADNFDLRSEYGSSSEDVRHRLSATAGMELFKGVRLGTIFSANSGLPYNITTGRDDNGDTVFNDRPAGVARNSARGAPQWDMSVRLSWLLGFGKAAAGSRSEGPRTVRVNSSDVGAISSELAAMEKRWRLNMYLQIYNLLNHVNATNYVGVQTSPFWGRPTGAMPGRRMEAGLRFSF